MICEVYLNEAIKKIFEPQSVTIFQRVSLLSSFTLQFVLHLIMERKLSLKPSTLDNGKEIVP